MAEFDPHRTLEALVSHGVDFVVIGGVAANLQGTTRVTFDLDIVFARDRANLESLAAALGELDAKLRGVENDLPFTADARLLDNVQILTLDTAGGPLDVQARPDGCPDYETLRRRADRMDVGGFSVLVASIDDLRAMKAAARRSKDEIDLEELDEIKRRKVR